VRRSLGSQDSHRRPHTHSTHPVERGALNEYFDLLTLQGPGPKPSSKPSLESRHRVLRQAPSCATGRHTPSITTLRLNFSQVLVSCRAPGRRVEAGAQACVLARQDGGDSTSADNRFVTSTRIIAPISRHQGDVLRHLRKQRRQALAVLNATCRDLYGDDFLGRLLDAKVELALSAATTAPVNFPRASRRLHRP